MNVSHTVYEDIRMNQELIARLSTLTEEEQRILRGGELQQSAYAEGASFIIAGRKLLPPARSITLRPHTRFVPFPAHSHDYVEMLCMVQGTTIHEFPGQEPLTLQAGDILLMNCRATHAIRQCGAEDVGVNFIVQPGFFDEAISAIGSGNALGQFLLDALGRGESSIPYLHFRVADSQAIQSLLESMIFSLVSDVPTSQRILKASMTALLLHLLEHADRLTVPTGGNALVVALLDEIRHNYASMSLTDFARTHRVSAAYLSQTVRRATGLTATEHLQRRRIDRAKKLLRETDLNVMEICAAVGYSNTSHFYRLFIALCGMNPTQWRMLNQDAD